MLNLNLPAVEVAKQHIVEMAPKNAPTLDTTTEASIIYALWLVMCSKDKGVDVPEAEVVMNQVMPFVEQHNRGLFVAGALAKMIGNDATGFELMVRCIAYWLEHDYLKKQA